MWPMSITTHFDLGIIPLYSILVQEIINFCEEIIFKIISTIRKYGYINLKLIKIFNSGSYINK